MAQKAYEQECDKLCIPILPAITRQLETQPQTLDFQRNYIGDKQGIALAAALKFYHPTVLKLPTNGLMNIGTRSILAAIEGSAVESIDLSHNDFSPSVVRDICRIIKTTQSLVEVKVVMCPHLKPEHIRLIQDAFQRKFQ